MTKMPSPSSNPDEYKADEQRLVNLASYSLPVSILGAVASAIAGHKAVGFSGLVGVWTGTVTLVGTLYFIDYKRKNAVTMPYMAQRWPRRLFPLAAAICVGAAAAIGSYGTFKKEDQADQAHPPTPQQILQQIKMSPY